MTNIVERYRARRNASRRRNAIERAIAKNPSQALRSELTTMMNRS